MAASAARMSPEFALVAALETVPVLRDGVTPMQPKKDRQAPFAFYVPTADTEEQLLDGPSGLQSFSATLNLTNISLHCATAHGRHSITCSTTQRLVLMASTAVMYSLWPWGFRQTVRIK